MGTLDRGIYLPTFLEDGWDAEVNANQSRLADLAFNIKAYGAVGNGTANDRSAIQAAVDAAAAAGGALWVPAGTYGVKSPVLLPPQVPIRGPGAEVAKIKAIGTWVGGASDAVLYGNGIDHSLVENITIDANNLASFAYCVGAGGTNAGHNKIADCQIKNATVVGVDAGKVVGGSETHVIRNDITGCPIAIRSGQDNEIAFNNMGSFTSRGISIEGGGTACIGNHPVSNGAGAAVCIFVLTGTSNVVEANYLDSGSASLAGPMLVVQPGAGNTLRGLIVRNNVFLAPLISLDDTYPAILLDMTTGTISNAQIMGNSGIGQNTTHRWSSVLKGVNTPGDTRFDPGNFYFCVEPYEGFTPAMLEPGLVYDGVTTKPTTSRHRYIDMTVSAGGAQTPFNARYGPGYNVNVTTASAFTLSSANQATGLQLEVKIRNGIGAGGVIGTITWTNFLFAGGAQPTWPANGKQLTVRFESDGSNWHELWRTSGDS